MIKNEYVFFTKEMNYWNEKAEWYLKLEMVQEMDRCLAQAAKCLLYRNQFSGEIYVVSGRKGDKVNRYYDSEENRIRSTS